MSVGVAVGSLNGFISYVNSELPCIALSGDPFLLIRWCQWEDFFIDTVVTQSAGNDYSGHSLLKTDGFTPAGLKLLMVYGSGLRNFCTLLRRGRQPDAFWAHRRTARDGGSYAGRGFGGFGSRA